MGGIISALLCLYIRSGCQASVVASALTFHPPDPCYRIEYDEESGHYALYIGDDSADVTRSQNIKVELLTSRTKTKIPVVVLTHPNAKYTIIYSHGNATDCGAMLPMYKMISEFLKVNVVGYDYTGYGASMEYGKRCTEKQTYIDIETVYEFCIESKLVSDPSKEIILYGQSVGSGPSCFLAPRKPIAGLVLHAPIMSGLRVQQIRGYCAPRKPIAGLVLHAPIMSGLRVLTDSRLLCCFDIFPNIDRINGINVPLFVIHGENDMEVMFKHGAGLLEAAPEGCQYEPWWVPGRGHNDVLFGNESEFIRRMAAYLQHVTQFHEEGRSLEIHTKHQKNSKKKVKNQDYGVQDKDVAMQQVAIV
eukprot:CAMPEP_0185015372 /NCGR_PEP_ID=MMETSP1098-20130426/99803_1 /TAXON_ID=89044 /ORGANISM="Spumella elongata, Strain CCAP 955/1" /LENGTH=360 /DNA_ID=CAMNT_0027544495 /DNA_START=153 /DNA_END=1236 /DNA_ORIENTATION=-